jgi:hypothetical protein
VPYWPQQNEARDIGVILGFTIGALIGGALTLRRRTR